MWADHDAWKPCRGRPRRRGQLLLVLVCLAQMDSPVALASPQRRFAILPRPHSCRRVRAAVASQLEIALAPAAADAAAAVDVAASDGEPVLKLTGFAGRPHTTESRAKISAANKGKVPWNAGKKHSEETRRKIAAGTRKAMIKRQMAARRKLEDELAAVKLTDPDRYELELAKFKLDLERKERRNAAAAARRLGLPPPPRKASSRVSTAKSVAVKRGGSNATLARGAPRQPRANFSFTEETKARISASLRKRWQDPEYRARRTNMTVSMETRLKLSVAMKAKWRDGEYRSRVSVNGSHTAERRQKIADAIKQKWQDPSYRNRTLAGIRQAHSSGSTRQRMSGETEAAWRKKISESMLRRWQDPQYRKEHALGSARPADGVAAPRARGVRRTVARKPRTKVSAKGVPQEDPDDQLMEWGDFALDFGVSASATRSTAARARSGGGGGGSKRTKSADAAASLGEGEGKDYIDMIMDGLVDVDEEIPEVSTNRLQAKQRKQHAAQESAQESAIPQPADTAKEESAPSTEWSSLE